MKKIFIYIGITLVIAFVLTGCEQPGFDRYKGKDINFSAKVPKSVITKTAYSGHVEGTIERIDWLNGDLIEIRCDQVSGQKYFDYDIAFDENVNTQSYATASPHGADHGLTWGSGTHTFFSMYPSLNTSGAQSGVVLALTGGSTGTATAVLPANQSNFSSIPSNSPEGDPYPTYFGDMRLAYMTAVQQSAEGADVDLLFKPMVTTFYVEVKNTTGATMNLSKVALSSSSCVLTGKYQLSMDQKNTRPGTYGLWDGSNYIALDFANEANEWNSQLAASNSTIYAEFSPKQVIANNESITVALFALPHKITDLTLTVTSDETGPVSLELKDGSNFIEFAGEKKHNISNINVPTVSYFLDVSPTVISYDYTGTYSNQEFYVESYKSLSGAKIAKPWKAQVQVGGDWVDLSTVLSNPSTYPGYRWLGNLPTLSEHSPDGTASSPTPRQYYRRALHGQDVTSHEDRLKAGVVYDTDGTTPLPHNSAETAIDLSYYDFENRKLDTKRYTANTYIISAPGYYKIPIVYGNGLENGATMSDSYSGRAARLGHLDEFICPYPNSGGTESSIHLVSTRPWLNERRSRSARIHWEKYSYWDEANNRVSTANRRHDQAAITSPVDHISITSGAGNERYIVFEITEANIRPGNFLMSSLDQYNNVQWSWQIWITDQDMAPVSINNGTRTYSIMPVNLGWTDLSKGLHYEAREAVLRFANTERSGLYSEHTLTVKQTEADLTSTSGWSTFYQWGRKDPQTEGITVEDNNDGYLHESIKHPSNIMHDKSSFFGDRYYDWTIHNYSNLWESKNTSYDDPQGTLPNHKTVYDPSPRRYCVPPDETFDGFTSYTSASSAGVYFPTGIGDKSVFFPAAGFMNYNASTSIGDNINNGYWTYHPGEGTERRASYCLNFRYNNSTNNVQIKRKSYIDFDGSNYISRAYGLSLRPVAYDESAVINNAPSDGTMTTIFNFEEMWGDGTTAPTNPSNLNGYTTNTPSTVAAAYSTDFSISFVSQLPLPSNKIRYEYDSSNGCYVVVWPESTLNDESNLGQYNRIIVSTTNPNIHIVQIALSVIKRGNTNIRTDSPTFSEDTWADSSASFDESTQQWTSGSGKQSVTFTTKTALFSTNNWELTGVTVYYFVTP